MNRILCIAMLFMCAGFFAGCSTKGQDEGPQKKITEAVEKAKGDDNGGYRLVSNGVAFSIPGDYDVSVEDETGNIYIDDPDLDFNMVMVVRDGSYEESLKDKDALTANAREKDVTILKDITEYTSDGKSYAYFTFEYNDQSSINTVIYTGASKGKRIGINMMINASDMTEEDVIDRINVFLKTAEASAQADTTRDDLIEQEGGSYVTVQADGERIDRTRLQLGDTSIAVDIPEGYLYQNDYDAYEEGMFSKQYFISPGLSEVTLSLYAEGLYTDLKELADTECTVNDNAKKARTEGPKETEYEGMKVVCKSVSYSYDGTEFHKAFAACELPDHSVYTVFAQNLDGEELSFDSIRDFMSVGKQ